MKSKAFNRAISVLLCLLMVTGLMSAALSAGAAVLPDNYETSEEYKDKTYQDLGMSFDISAFVDRSCVSDNVGIGEKAQKKAQ